MTHFTSVDEYIASFHGVTQERLKQIHQLVRQQLPDAEERISYNMPAYFASGRLVIYFAGFKNHIGMYPGRTNSDAYNKLAAQYAYGKSTARFSNSEPLPAAVVEQFVATRLKEIG